MGSTLFLVFLVRPCGWIIGGGGTAMLRDTVRIGVWSALALARAFERVGGIAGAVLAAVLSATLGYRSATALLGIIVLTLGLGTVSLLRPVRSREFAHG